LITDNKRREVSKVIKRYDAASMPYQRLMMSSSQASSKVKSRLKIYERLDPVALFEQISTEQDDL